MDRQGFQSGGVVFPYSVQGYIPIGTEAVAGFIGDKLAGCVIGPAQEGISGPGGDGFAQGHDFSTGLGLGGRAVAAAPEIEADSIDIQNGEGENRGFGSAGLVDGIDVDLIVTGCHVV